MENYVNFYPTPEGLLEKMVSGLDFKEIKTVLEPSAGKGNIIEYLSNVEISGLGYSYKKKLDIDCIELNEELRATLKGKNYRVVADDFLNFNTYKHYDLIIMNPPFDRGCEHLLKAIEMQESGGKIVCILNAETLDNPYTISRQILLKKLEQHNAEITYSESEFVSAERKTNVKVAIVKIDIPEKEKQSLFFDEIKKGMSVRSYETDQVTDVAENDYLKAAVMRYEIEVKAGLELIREYKAMVPYMLGDLKETTYSRPILELKCDGNSLDENEYIKCVREKYWRALFSDDRFTSAMPQEMLENHREQVKTLREYDFSYYNIKEIQIQICNSLVDGIEKSIMELFDELTFHHAYYPECTNNIHYYTGWCQNKAWYVNNKVILPMHCYSTIWKRIDIDWKLEEKLRDMEKAFDYLNGTPGRVTNLYNVLAKAKKEEVYKNVETKYMTLTFHKKGTVHIVFKDLELLKKLNIFGGKNKNMLPPRYGKVPYEQMTPEEKEIVKEFDGSESEYNKVFLNKDQYLFDVKSESVLQITG